MTKIVGIDTETTSIRPDRRLYDLALIVLGDDDPPGPWEQPGWRPPGLVDKGTYQWFIDVGDLDLGNADPFALRVGKFYERHPQMGVGAGAAHREADVLRQVERLTRGAHLLGAVPNFDADVLDRRMRAHGILPSWHYHLIDIEAAAVGYLYGRNDPRMLPDDELNLPSLPWKSDDLSRACGVEPATEEERHTALGDAKHALRWYEAITGGKS